MAVPTLALIPAAQGSKLYSVLPSNGSGDFDFSRGTIATRVNSKGLIEEVASGVSRLDYTGGGCPSLLLEPQSTNLIEYSQELDNAYWQVNGLLTSGFVSPSADSPLGAFKWVFGGNQTFHGIQPLNFSTTAGTTYTYSFYARTISGTYSLNIGGLFSSPDDWEAQTVTNEWQRFERTQISAGGKPEIYSNGTAGELLIFGAQLEQSPYASSLIPTNGGTVTRLAETATGSGDAATFNDSEGVLFVDISALTSVDDFRILTLNDGSLDNIILIGLRDNGTIWSTITDNAAGQFTYISNYVPINVPLKLLIKYKTNDVSFWINGVKVATSTSATIPTGLNSIDFNYGNGANNFYGNVKQLQYYNTADLTDLELEKLTQV